MKKKEELVTQKEERKDEILIPILAGSDFDLSLFDFSFINVSIYNIKSEAFRDYTRSIQPDCFDVNWMFFEDLIEEIKTAHDEKYAIVANNPLDQDIQDLYNVWRLLLIIFPSDLVIEHVIHFTYTYDMYQVSSMSTWDRRYSGNYPGNPLKSSKDYINEINEFSKLYFNRLNDVDFLGIAIENYITSFSASHLHYQFLTLCIALESVVHGEGELTYRIRRTIAVLCGKDGFNCDVIYDNLNKIYKLRSKIVHGENYEMKKVEDYISALQVIVSRAIIELLVHGIAKNEELNKRITRLGFGERDKISGNWRSFKLNPSTIIDSNWIRLD